MTVYEDNRAWADGLMPQVIRVLSSRLLRVGTFREDTEQCCDLRLRILLSSEGNGAVGVRLRRPDVWGGMDRNTGIPYKLRFTLRAWCASGAPTELQKIGRGEGALFFYGFTLDDRVRAYHLLRVDPLRAWLKANSLQTIANTDRATGFIPICVRDVKDAHLESRLVFSDGSTARWPGL